MPNNRNAEKEIKKHVVGYLIAIFLLAAGIFCQSMKDGIVRCVQRQIDQIKFLEIATVSWQEKPVIILQHGLGGSKEDMRSWAEYLAECGYIAVILDAAGCGDHAAENPLDLPDMISTTAEWYDEILEYYQDSGRMRNHEFALLGMSMGGMIVMYYGAYGHYIPKCVMGLYTSFDWESLVDDEEIYIQMENGKVYAVCGEADRKVIRDKMMEYSPLNGAGQLFQAPVLMINGDQDPIMPLPDLGQLHDFRKEGDSEQLFFPPELIVRQNQGHDIAEGDTEAMMAFLSHCMYDFKTQ